MLAQSQEWLEWAAYNIAVGVSETAVKEEILKSGLTEGEFSSFLSSLKSSPEFRAMKKLSRKYKLACDLNEALIALESEVFNFNEISRIEGLPPDEFLLKFYAANRPVILTDIASKWPAVEKWSLEFLSETYGEEPIVYQNGRSADDHRDSFVDHTVKGTLGDYIKLIQNVPAGVNPPYLIAHDRLLDRASFKPLLNDVVFDDRYLSAHDSHGRVFFWLGPALSSTPMHRDLGNVYMAQIAGRKLIRMVPSKEIQFIYNEIGYHSEADFDNLALDKFPLLRNAHIMEFTLHPGEFLFIPVGWWHFVKSLDTTITVTGNNFRFLNNLRPIFE
ncbi:cupin-like domain-containing protein [Rhizobium rhizogenes]|uniref:Uncharacterized conserved protein n=1 Tax=Rhizobium rhizogenes (strain K84 / ATCC BAA-868) TaxID=311403 RepID=B9JNX0_RHIR8|nr:Uncharacterized conserved protein [Rhizobium rhizogenes K84]